MSQSTPVRPAPVQLIWLALVGSIPAYAAVLFAFEPGGTLDGPLGGNVAGVLLFGGALGLAAAAVVLQRIALSSVPDGQLRDRADVPPGARRDTLLIASWSLAEGVAGVGLASYFVVGSLILAGGLMVFSLLLLLFMRPRKVSGSIGDGSARLAREDIKLG